MPMDIAQEEQKDSRVLLILCGVVGSGKVLISPQLALFRSLTFKDFPNLVYFWHCTTTIRPQLRSTLSR